MNDPDTIINFRVDTPEEKRELKHIAVDMGITLSQLMRACAKDIIANRHLYIPVNNPRKLTGDR